MRIIHLARKPLEESSVASNILKHGTGALNINAGRITAPGETITNNSRSDAASKSKGIYGDSSGQETHQTAGQKLGRWPANVILQHHADCGDACAPGCPVADLDNQTGDRPVSGAAKAGRPATGGGTGAATVAFGIEEGNGTLHADKGGASRYYKQVGQE
jgi:hypothetical protein